MDTAQVTFPALSDCSDLPAVPLRVLSRDGAVIETSTDFWRLCRTSDLGSKHCIDWSLLDQVGLSPLLTVRACHLLKLYMADRLFKKKARTVKTNYSSFLRLIRWLTAHVDDILVLSDPRGFNWSDLSEGIVRAFLEWSVKHTAEKGHDFCCLRTFYEWGVARGYADFQRDLLSRLQTIKAPYNAKGHHVRFRHPIKGPFSPDELFQIRKALQAKQGTDQDRAIVMLHLELGLNPYTSMQITNADFKRYETEHLVAYHIDVPRIKKRTVHRETKRRPVSQALGQLLERLQRGDSQDQLLHWLPSSDPRQGIERAMGRFVKTAGIVSPATGTLLKMTPRRFRTSLATAMAAQGASKFHIAEILDHSDLGNVDVYTQTVSSIADQVTAAIDPTLGPLVGRFLGMIANEPAEAVSQDLLHQQIPAHVPHLPLPMLPVGGIGSCARDIPKDGLCRLLPPLSCYLCPCFVASRSGPHQEMLDALLNALKLGSGMGDGRIKRQLDDVCTAIAEVLAQLGEPAENPPDLYRS